MLVEFVAFYGIFSLCFVFPPSAFVAAGLTITNLCASWLGSEDLLFTIYHVRRTAATIVIHSLLPFGFFCGLLLLEGYRNVVILLQYFPWFLLFCISIAIPLIKISQVLKWKSNNWEKHPLAVSLARYTTNDRPWTSVASEIDNEFRRIDKVTIRTNAVSKIVITSSWILKLSPYSIEAAHQNHVALTLLEHEEHNFTANNQLGAQFLLVQVQQILDHKPLFTIRLNAMDYVDVQDRLQSPIDNVRGVIINQDVHARFRQVFIEEVGRNPIFQSQEEMEPCLGCMQSRANTRLVRRCAPSPDSRCTPCFCRPMWCIHCLAKWFSARQDSEHPETWLSSCCPCPTCRSPFCILDVSLIDHVENI